MTKNQDSAATSQTMQRKNSSRRPTISRNRTSASRVQKTDDPQKSKLVKEQSDSRHILVVEDNPVNMMLLVRFAKTKGLKVSTAENGALALEAVEARPTPFAAILMDINMPVMNGFEAISKIRGLEQDKKCRIAAVTGLSNETDRQEARKRGADAFLTKPVKMAQLAMILTSWGILEGECDGEEIKKLML